MKENKIKIYNIIIIQKIQLIVSLRDTIKSQSKKPGKNNSLFCFFILQNLPKVIKVEESKTLVSPTERFCPPIVFKLVLNKVYSSIIWVPLMYSAGQASRLLKVMLL